MGVYVTKFGEWQTASNDGALYQGSSRPNLDGELSHYRIPLYGEYTTQILNFGTTVLFRRNQPARDHDNRKPNKKGRTAFAEVVLNRRPLV